jgi:hypothetical protein
MAAHHHFVAGKQNLDRKASAELFCRGAAALQETMEAQIRSELEHLKECSELSAEIA